MNGAIVYAVLIIGLFSVAFMTKRRIGAPILGLAAGSVLANLWAEDIAVMSASYGARLDGIMLGGVIEVTLILLPAILLMMHGHVHKSALQRLIAAGLFTVVALAFLVNSTDSMVVADGVSQSLSQPLRQYQGWIIAIGLIGAVIDLALTKLHKPAPPKAKH